MYVRFQSVQRNRAGVAFPVAQTGDDADCFSSLPPDEGAGDGAYVYGGGYQKIDPAVQPHLRTEQSEQWGQVIRALQKYFLWRDVEQGMYRFRAIMPGSCAKL